ncbi:MULTISPECIES: DUF4381 domain-containing protein [unclassified Chelatococcus]|uniref:DUF4381 domain-containing protein n=1 Tax=unclassified Chelatococcus TaxID=2638111 RepID=UPI001BCA8C8B|nr:MULTISPECIES: DUF4381 domain-containing protein [unclassified Chelatococcus]CAH1668846.1 conserved hypothetical protein [Hyphomicrobiales bacterium]MBS7739410.1 DUF4381 domain-containing protein [Chelatococcus sp. HY11]MBX3543779.1 DUF4381 domain-containing protein [Chelatococcus sp.]MCO5076055.1 DUF4381 domain-containing protein [Chelatococcus sp.]CAH1679690.1 conserved hypothetical protein [Hyphomicrobiales bacterium]
MNPTTDPADLANLRDIVLPPAIPYWPPASGWWILGLVLLACLAILIARMIARYRHNGYRRAALRELRAIGPATDTGRAQATSAVLKRAALVAFPRENVAALTGEPWLSFLDRSGRMEAFSTDAGRDLVALSCGAPVRSDGVAIAAAAERWISRHHGDDVRGEA